LTPLLASHEALRQALSRLRNEGYHAAKLLIVEYCDSRDESGLIRKYSAFNVGGVIIAKHLIISRHWVVKDESRLGDEELDEAKVYESLQYIQTNPHETWIRETFALAQIDYGRIDYGFSGGMPQVWEINTDPTIARLPRPRPPRLEQYRSVRKLGQDFFHDRFQAALAKLDQSEDGDRDIPISLEPSLRRRLRAELRRREVSQAIGRCVERFVDAGAVQRLKPLLKPAAAPLNPFLGWVRRLPGSS
jgi:hypothetical protein